VDSCGKAAKLGKDGFRQRLCIPPGNGAEQQKLQQFIIRERFRTSLLEARAAADGVRNNAVRPSLRTPQAMQK
jgi:hypothetical protein